MNKVVQWLVVVLVAACVAFVILWQHARGDNAKTELRLAQALRVYDSISKLPPHIINHWHTNTIASKPQLVTVPGKVTRAELQRIMDSLQAGDTLGATSIAVYTDTVADTVAVVWYDAFVRGTLDAINIGYRVQHQTVVQPPMLIVPQPIPNKTHWWVDAGGYMGAAEAGITMQRNKWQVGARYNTQTKLGATIGIKLH